MNIYNKNGELSDYGLRCGYVERKTQSNGKREVQVDLYHDGIYHVRVIVRETENFMPLNRYNDEYWYNTDSLTDARKMYRTQSTNKKMKQFMTMY